jgi:hypothetical protein
MMEGALIYDCVSQYVGLHSPVVAPSSDPKPISNNQYRCENAVIANAALHGVGTAVGNIKGTVAKLSGLFRASVPALGTYGVEGATALGASAEIAATIGSAVSGAGEIAAIGTTIYIAGSGVYGAYSYYRDNIGSCAGIP